MITLRYVLTALSRVSAGSSPEVGNNRTIHSLLPGGTVRGAVATAYTREHDLDWSDARVREIFQRATRFGQAVPDGWELRGLSHATCKYPKPGCPTALTDFALLIAEDRHDVPMRCPSCGRAWETFKGWQSSGDRSIETSVTRTELIGGVARDERLFTRRAIDRRTVLRGQLMIDDDRLDDAEIDWLRGRHRIRVGGQRSGLGDVRWETEPAPEAPPSGQDHRGRVVLRCTSPTILCDRTGAPTLDPEPEMRRRWGDDVRVVARWTRSERVAGWHMASGLPKPEEWALSAGSTFVVEGLPPTFGELIDDGLGLRRSEGFGAWQVITDPVPYASTLAIPEEPAYEAPTSEDEVALPSTEPDPPDDAPTAAAAPVPPIERIIAAVDAAIGVKPETGRRGLNGALAKVIMYRKSGFHESIVNGIVRDALNTPWARAIPDVTDDLRTLLLGDLAELQVAKAQLEQDQRGQR